MKPLSLKFGPVMWRCTNGAPNHATEWWARKYFYKHCTAHNLPLYPVVCFSPWHGGCMNRDNPLGQKTHSLTICVEFLFWQVGIMIGRTLNTKTQTQIDAVVERVIGKGSR